MTICSSGRFIAPLIGLSMGAVAHADFDFSRSDFDGSLSTHVGFLGTGGVASYTEPTSEGKPGSWGNLLVQGQGPGGPDIHGFAYVTFDSWQFKPTSGDPVISIDSEADTRNYTLQDGYNLDSALFVILRQGSDYYVHGGGNGHGDPWFHEATESNALPRFYKIEPATGHILFGAGPDLNGSPITLGFGMDCNFPTTETEYSGVDNLHYHVNATPEPASLLAFGAGLPYLLRKRRSTS